MEIHTCMHIWREGGREGERERERERFLFTIGYSERSQGSANAYPGPEYRAEVNVFLTVPVYGAVLQETD